MNDRPSRKLAVILHADVVGSTALVHMSESLAHARIQAAFQRLSDTIAARHGITHELRGDALVAEFARASDAVTAALAFQADNAGTNERLDDDLRPRVRVGISLGEVVIADGTVTGAGVVLAQRVEQLADDNGVCVTGAVREAAPQHLPYEYTDLGVQPLKGFDQPVQIYAVSVPTGIAIPEPDPPSDAGEARPVRSTRLRLAAVLVVIALAAGAFSAWWTSRPEFAPASAERMAFPLPDKPSIAVLPFDNLSADPEQAFLADGMTVNIIATLARIPELFVIAQSSVFTYKNQPVQVQRAAEELGVRYVLKGSVQRSGEHLRITVQLVDATSGHHLWSERFDREVGHLFELQDEIALKTAIELQVKLAGGRPSFLTQNTTHDIRAWLAFVEANSYHNQYTPEGQLRARELYTQALEYDERFADAWIGLGWIHWNDARFRRTADHKVSLAKAWKMAGRAAALAPDTPELAILRGQLHLYQDEFAEAQAELRHAVELSPSDSRAIAVLGQTLLYSGRYDEAITLTERAMRLNPFYPSWFLLNLGRAHVLKGNPARAVEIAELGIAHAESYFMTAAHRVTLAMAYAEAGDLPKAKATMAKVLERVPDLTVGKYAERYRFAHEQDWNRFAGLLRDAGLPDDLAK